MPVLNLLRSLAATFALCACIAAHASPVMVYDLTGTVYTGYDTTGVFGTPASSLVGSSISAHFVFDLGLGSRAIGVYTDELVGGPQVALSMPMLAGSITVNGVQADYPLDGFIHNLAQVGFGGPNHLQIYVDYYLPPLRADHFKLFLDSYDMPASLSATYSTTNLLSFGQFQIRTDDPSGSFFQKFAQGQFTVDSVTVTTGDVPEPASLALLGLALLALVVVGRQARPRSGKD